jgi:hypothetical protein
VSRTRHGQPFLKGGIDAMMDRFKDGTVLRRYRADLAGSLTRYGRPLQPESLRASHRGVMAFLLMLDSLDRGRAELRVRSDGGAKGAKTRRVPITPRLAAAAMKRYSSLDRPESDSQAWLLNRHGQPFLKGGIDAMMDRFKERVGSGSTPTRSAHVRDRGDPREGGTWSGCGSRWATGTTRCSSGTWS